ncbi:hypothetical protein BGZ83_005593 [Gryganskiella cystojenkinii]|nr:hypothetical protein BGZ83_005593 [Gryganskiella cystojenkinii]
MDLLEIRRCVGPWIDMDALTSCVRVSRDWYDTFIPFLYRKQCPDVYRKSWSSFQRHIEHVRDLKIPPFLSAQGRRTILQGCHLLERIENTCNTPDYLDFIFKLVQANNTRLTRLDLHGLTNLKQLPPPLYGIFLHTIADADVSPHLTDLRLNSVLLENEALQGFLKLAPRLTRLDLNFCRAQDDRSETWSNWPKENLFPELRELKLLDVPDFKPCEEVLRLFEHCPKLESLSWKLQGRRAIKPFVKTLCAMLQGIKEDQPDKKKKMDYHEDRFRQDGTGRCCWPRLDSVRIIEGYVYSRSLFRDELVAQLIDCCPNPLRRLTLPMAHFGNESWKSLKRHGQFKTLRTLQVLEVSTEGWMIQEILTSCPELREFRGGTLHTSEFVKRIDCGANEDDFLIGDDLSNLARTRTLPPRPWVCRNLQVLKITLRRSPEDDEKVDALVFAQLRKITTLRELSLCDRSADYTKYGLDPRVPMGIKDLVPFKDRPLRGEYENIRRIRDEPVIRKLLEIWPLLENCCWHPVSRVPSRSTLSHSF